MIYRSMTLGGWHDPRNAGARVDIRHFGARPDRPEFDNAPAIQAAVDFLRTSGRRAMYIPPGRWHVHYPIYLERPDTFLVGDHRDTSVIVGSEGAFPVFQVGPQRLPGGVAIPSGHWFDLSGYLDDSVSSSRWGFRTLAQPGPALGRPKLIVQSAPFVYGPPSETFGDLLSGDWRELRQFTFEFGYINFTNTHPTLGSRISGGTGLGASIWGIGADNLYQPFWFSARPSNHRLGLRMRMDRQDGSHFGEININVDQPTSVGMHRVAHQVDLDAGVAITFVDGLQVAITAGSTSWEPGLVLKPFEYGFFGLGGEILLPTQTNDQESDFVVAGLLLYKGLRYKNNGIGQPQERIDEGPVNDAYRFFHADPNTIAYFRFDDEPGKVAWSIGHGDSPAKGYAHLTRHGFSHSAHPAPVMTRRVGIEKLGRHGSCINTSHILHPHFTESRFAGGAVAIDNLHVVTTYVIRMDDVVGYSHEAFVFGSFLSASLSDITLERVGRNFIRGWQGYFAVEGVRVRDPGAVEEYFRVPGNQGSGIGGIVNLQNFRVESSRPGLPRNCDIYVEPPSFNFLASGTANVVSLQNDFGVDSNRLAPVVNINASNLSEHNRQNYAVSFRDNQVGDRVALASRARQRVYGGMAGPFGAVGPLAYTGSDGQHEALSLYAVEGQKRTPPRVGHWIRDRHEWSLGPTPPGMPALLRCAATGTFGTASPPEWDGDDVVRTPGGSELGAIMHDHSFVSVGIKQ